METRNKAMEDWEMEEPASYLGRENDHTVAWDCNLFFVPESLDYDLDIDYESDDWQIIALDRFGDRFIQRNYA